MLMNVWEFKGCISQGLILTQHSFQSPAGPIHGPMPLKALILLLLHFNGRYGGPYICISWWHNNQHAFCVCAITWKMSQNALPWQQTHTEIKWSHLLYYYFSSFSGIICLSPMLKESALQCIILFLLCSNLVKSPTMYALLVFSNSSLLHVCV